MAVINLLILLAVVAQGHGQGFNLTTCPILLPNLSAGTNVPFTMYDNFVPNTRENKNLDSVCYRFYLIRDKFYIAQMAKINTTGSVVDFLFSLYIPVISGYSITSPGFVARKPGIFSRTELNWSGCGSSLSYFCSPIGGVESYAAGSTTTPGQSFQECADRASAQLRGAGLAHPDGHIALPQKHVSKCLYDLFISKLDKQTGGAGGADKKLDETDLLIIEILGKDSPVIKGLGLPDSMGFGRNEKSDASPSDSRDPIDENVDDPLTHINQKCQSFDKLESTHSLPVAATSVKGPGKRVLVQMSDITKQQELLKKQKLELEVRKLQIEVWNRENELGITHTKLTEQIERKVEEVDSNTSNEMIGQPLVILDNSNCVVNDDGKIILLQNMSMNSSA